MPTYNLYIKEEELKNKVAHDYFPDYDCTQIIGNIDICIAIPQEEDELAFETESLLWAEAKNGNKKDIYESFVQLILTIGKARTFDDYLPPKFIGAFDAEKIAFLPYNNIIDIFYQNDFNWNVTPSDHDTKEFRQLYEKVRGDIERGMLPFRFGADDKELRSFIKKNFLLGRKGVSAIRINKNNFTHIYQKWLSEVKPTIAIDWDIAKKEGLIDADFYLADILSEHDISLREKLFVLLREDRYVYNIQRKMTGAMSFESVDFNDNQVSHTQFWNRYDRPPRREYWDYIVARRDLLVPQDVRERKGSFFTPKRWVELSQQYLAAELGEDWQDEYYVWDCAAGTGNLLNGLTNKYNLWATTLDAQDVKAMHDLIGANKLNLLERHVFQFDFLNDSFDKLPKPLREIINDEERRKKLVIYINPPYAEAATVRQKTGTGTNKANVARNNSVYSKYKTLMGGAVNELFAQFFIRIYNEIPSSVLAEFSTLKILQAPNFRDFRNIFRAKLGRNFLVPADTFDNVKGKFPIGFFIWHTDERKKFLDINTDVYDRHGHFMGHKGLYAPIENRLLMDWLKTKYDKKSARIAYLRMLGSDVQNNNGVFLTTTPSESDLKQRKTCDVTAANLSSITVYFSVRHCIESEWVNDRDQYQYPEASWEGDLEFQSDCLVYTLFHGQNRISALSGPNHWLPFTEQEVGAQEKFASHFMTDYISGKNRPATETTPDLFSQPQEASRANAPLSFSPEAAAVMKAGRELWQYYHAQPEADPNAAFHDIRLHFQGRNEKGKMNSGSLDEHYTRLIAALRQNLKQLAKKIEPKVYEHGFLLR